MISRMGRVDAAGWVRGVHIMEGPRPPRRDDAIPLSEDESHRVLSVPGFHHGPDGLEVAQDDRVAWKALRKFGRPGPAAFADLDLVREYRAAVPRDLSVPVADPAPLMAGHAPVGFTGWPAEGLTLEAMHAGHLDAACAIAIQSNLYPETCPPTCGKCTPPEAHAWLELAGRLDSRDQWQFCLTFQGRPLQYEVITFDSQRTTATFAITYHTAAGRERPAWFHREAEQPVFAALQQLGIRTLDSRTRSDRPDWIAALKATYGAVERGQIGPITRLEFPLELSRFTGWPVRTTLGHDVTTGRLRQWEATAADLPALKAYAQTALPAEQRATVLRMIDEWWHLDRATILLTARDGELRYARGMRFRRNGTVSSANFAPVHDDPEVAGVVDTTLAWCRAAGYQKLTTFAPKRALRTRHAEIKLGKVPMRQVREKPDPVEPEGYVELELDL